MGNYSGGNLVKGPDLAISTLLSLSVFECLNLK